MIKYVIKRLLLMIPVVLGVVLLVFTILYFSPGDAVDVIAATDWTDAEKDALRHEMGLDQPYYKQLLNYYKQIFIDHDFGKALVNKTDILSDLKERIPFSVTFGLLGIFFSVVLGIPLGIYAALHQDKPGDFGATVLALLGNSTPGFFLALLLVLLFSYKLGWFPAYGLGSIRHWILPILANCFGGVANMCRQTRSGMLEVIRSDYVVMAKAKGLSRKTVIWKHALPNALIPLITSAGMMFGQMLGGGLIIEKVFSIPGMGMYLVTAVQQRDTNAVQGGVIITSIFFSLVMLAADLAIAFADPRIKAKYQKTKKRRRTVDA